MKVVFEDESLLVIEKPPFLVVNRSLTAKNQTLQDLVGRYLKLKDLGLGGRAGIVHRLDKDTSGLMVVAKTAQAFENLQSQFKNRRVEKRYMALVHGQIKPPEGVVRLPICRSPFDRKKFGVFLGGREAETGYKKTRQVGDYSLLELYPKTGRTHQLRVHLKHLGYPIAGDELYAGRKNLKGDKVWCPRLFLHASFLAFFHPLSDQRLTFQSVLPADLEKALSLLIN